MAVGDVVSDIGGDNAILDFQPAAGVEAVISLWFTGQTNGDLFLYNGTDTSTNLPLLQTTVSVNTMKMFVNNTNYFRSIAPGAGLRNAFTGIETNA